MTKQFTRGQFASALLSKIGAPHSRRNMRALLAWMQAEGDAGRFNPLNTTKGWTGATNFNWVGVKNYATFLDGVAATAATLNYGADRNLYGYKQIRVRLRANRPAWRTLTAIEKSQWGTGGLALKVLRTVNVLAVIYKNHPLSQ